MSRAQRFVGAALLPGLIAILSIIAPGLATSQEAASTVLAKMAETYAGLRSYRDKGSVHYDILGAQQEVDALEERFDTELGPHTRRWAYGQVLPQTKLLRSAWARGVPPLEASLLPLITPFVRRLVCMGYKITPESAQRSLELCEAFFGRWTNC